MAVGFSLSLFILSPDLLLHLQTTKERSVQGRSALRGTTLIGQCCVFDPGRTTLRSPGVYSGDEGIRTPCLLNAIEALSQMSYIPKTDTALLQAR
jgi:hypothetical protein